MLLFVRKMNCRRRQQSMSSFYADKFVHQWSDNYFLCIPETNHSSLGNIMDGKKSLVMISDKHLLDTPLLR